MRRENASFLVGGIFFGFMVGFSVAYYFYHQVPSGGTVPASMAAPTNPSDPMGVGAAPAPPAAGGGAPGGTEAMQAVQREIASLRKTLEDNPKDAAALGRMGDLFYDAGMFDKARDYYLRSLESQPRNPDISTDLGICLRQLGQPDAAIERFRASIAIEPGHWQSWLNLGIVSLFDKGDLKTAEEAFGRVRELNPSFAGLAEMQKALDQAKAGK